MNSVSRKYSSFIKITRQTDFTPYFGYHNIYPIRNDENEQQYNRNYLLVMLSDSADCQNHLLMDQKYLFVLCAVCSLLFFLLSFFPFHCAPLLLCLFISLLFSLLFSLLCSHIYTQTHLCTSTYILLFIVVRFLIQHKLAHKHTDWNRFKMILAQKSMDIERESESEREDQV